MRILLIFELIKFVPNDYKPKNDNKLKMKPNYKFLNQIVVPGLGQTLDDHDQHFTQENNEKFRSENADNFYAGIIKDDKVIFCSKLEIKGRELWIPEPNPVHIYFYNSFRKADELIKSQLEFENMAIQLKGSSNLNTYPFLIKFVSISTEFIFNAFTSIEAFINQSIPEAFTYISEKRKSLTKTEIERKLYFKEKSSTLMNSIFSKNIQKEHADIYQSIWLLKELRDDLLHLKTQNDKFKNQYRKVINELLNFDYLDCIQNVEKYMNYFKPNFIEHQQ